MTTKELIDVLEGMGFMVVENETYIDIYRGSITTNACQIAMISKKVTGELSTSCPGFRDLSSRKREALISVLGEYSWTPINDRTKGINDVQYVVKITSGEHDIQKIPRSLQMYLGNPYDEGRARFNSKEEAEEAINKIKFRIIKVDA